MRVIIDPRLDPKTKTMTYVVQTITAEKPFPTKEAAEAYKRKLDQDDLRRRRHAMQNEL